MRCCWHVSASAPRPRCRREQPLASEFSEWEQLRRRRRDDGTDWRQRERRRARVALPLRVTGERSPALTGGQGAAKG